MIYSGTSLIRTRLIRIESRKLSCGYTNQLFLFVHLKLNSVKNICLFVCLFNK